VVDNREPRVELTQGLHLSSAFGERRKDLDRRVEDASRGPLSDLSGHRGRGRSKTVQQHQTSLCQNRSRKDVDDHFIG